MRIRSAFTILWRRARFGFGTRKSAFCFSFLLVLGLLYDVDNGGGAPRRREWCAPFTMGSRTHRRGTPFALTSLLLLCLARPVAPADASEATAPSPSAFGSKGTPPLDVGAGAGLHKNTPKTQQGCSNTGAPPANEGRHRTQAQTVTFPEEVRFTSDAQNKFSNRLQSLLIHPCEGYARNLIDESAFDLQHASVVLLRETCENAPAQVPGQTTNPCADLTNAVNIILDHREAVDLLKQLLHEKCQSDAVRVSTKSGGYNDRAKSRNAASYLVKDTVRKVAEDEQTLRDHYGVPTDRKEIERRPRVSEDGVFLLGPTKDGGEETVSENDGRDDGECNEESGMCSADAAGEYKLDVKESKRDVSSSTSSQSSSSSWRFAGVDATDVAFDPLPDIAKYPDLVEEIRRVERVVLTELYKGTEGSRWLRQRNWLSRKSHCQWEGVFCSSEDAIAGVLALQLSDNKLNGVLPQTLARLHRLRYLDVSHNTLRGEISSAFGSLKGLKSLSLRSNNLRGEIPVELSAAIKLEKLDLSGNNLVGEVPEGLGNRLLNLIMFNVSSNGLSGALPVTVCGLPYLEVFSASGNKFTDGLVAASNALRAVVDSKLIIFDVSENSLQGPPPMLPVDSGTLAIWDVSNNPLSGQFPDTFATPISLKVFSTAGANNLIGLLPGSLFPINSQLRKVDLSNCGFDGSLPDELMGLEHVRTVNISGNSFSDRIPSEGVVDIRKMKKLTQFDCSKNNLNGTLPASLAGLSSLRLLDVSNNELQGPLLGSQLLNLHQVLKLDFSNNKYSGKLPHELSSLKNLRWLDLSRNQFTGAVPVGLLTNKNLEHLDVSQNELDWSSL